MENIWNDKDLIISINNGGIAVMPTDTIYGIVASALQKKAVEKVAAVKERASDKPFIILISKIDDLDQFDIKLTNKQRDKLDTFWPGPVSVILSTKSKDLSYLTMGGDTLAFRLPQPAELQRLISCTGPLIAPSANPEGMPPATNINEARKYFGEKIDHYSKSGEIRSKASSLVRLDEDGNIKIFRK